MEAQPLTVRVCTGLCCGMAGANDLAKSLPSLLGGMAPVRLVPCIGRCDEAPAVLVGRLPLPAATNEAVLNIVINELTMPDAVRGMPDAPQDFLDGEGYRAEGGYGRLALIAGSDSEAMRALEAIAASGLGSSDGAMLGQRLRALRESEAPRELIASVCGMGLVGSRNRQLLERDPHRFIEGLLIAAQIAECKSVKVVMRDEFELREMLQSELLELAESPPGELPSITFVSGIAPKEALSFESLYWLRDVLDKGAEWFGGFGRNGARGLRTFVVAGRIAEPGVKVVPAGITLHDLVEEYCGGMEEGHRFRAAIVKEAAGTVVVLGSEDADRLVEGAQTLLDASVALK